MQYRTPGTLDHDRVSELAKALGHPARIQIVELLSRQRECTGVDVFSELPLAQSTVSEHLRVLREAGIVRSSRSGIRAVYCLNQDALDELAAALSGLSGMFAAEECRCGE